MSALLSGKLSHTCLALPDRRLIARITALAFFLGSEPARVAHKGTQKGPPCNSIGKAQRVASERANNNNSMTIDLEPRVKLAMICNNN